MAACRLMRLSALLARATQCPVCRTLLPMAVEGLLSLTGRQETVIRYPVDVWFVSSYGRAFPSDDGQKTLPAAVVSAT